MSKASLSNQHYIEGEGKAYPKHYILLFAVEDSVGFWGFGFGLYCLFGIFLFCGCFSVLKMTTNKIISQRKM